MKKQFLICCLAVLLTVISTKTNAAFGKEMKSEKFAVESTFVKKTMSLAPKTCSFYFYFMGYTVNCIIKTYDDGSWGYMYSIQHGTTIVSSGYAYFGVRPNLSGIVIDESTLEYFFDEDPDPHGDFFFTYGFDTELITQVNANLDKVE